MQENEVTRGEIKVATKREKEKFISCLWIRKSILSIIFLLSFGFIFAQNSILSSSAKELIEILDNGTKKIDDLIGKNVIVTGVVIDTGISRYLTPYVTLSDSSDGDEYAVCVLPRADSRKLSQFKKGDQVAIQGNIYAKPGNRIVIKQAKKID